MGSVISYICHGLILKKAIIELLTLKDKETKAQRLREIYEAHNKWTRTLGLLTSGIVVFILNHTASPDTFIR